MLAKHFMLVMVIFSLGTTAASHSLAEDGKQAASSSPRPLDLDDVVRLSQAKVAPQVIKAFILRHHLQQALTADDLIMLTKQNVPADVINVVQSLHDTLETQAVPKRLSTKPHAYTVEELHSLLREWERFWSRDQPDHKTPYRVHGGVI